MRIIAQAVRVIDYENDRVWKRDIPPNFKEYLEQLISYINGNKSVREYKARSTDGEVISGILEIVKHQDEDEVILQNVDRIARHLLGKERAAAERIAQLPAKVQKGSLVLALLEDEGNLLFLLAKVEHADFYDEADYIVKSGFPKDEKKIWKTCVFEIDHVEAAEFFARVYSNTEAKYWWYDFLDLEELKSDEFNTKKALRSVETALSKELKKLAPHDHMVLQNSVYLYFNSTEHFDYDELMERTLRHYTSVDMTEEIRSKLLETMEELPGKNGFDRQFRPVPSAIRPKLRKTYEVYNGIQIRIQGGVEDLGDIIQAHEAHDGKRYLQIRISEPGIYEIFKG